MKVLVTGSSGFIGGYLVEWFRSRGFRVLGLDFRPGVFTDVVGDVRDYGLVGDLMRGVEAVVHCAAQTSVPRSVEDPVFDAWDNVMGTLSVLEAARRAGGIKRFVYLSSAAVYGMPRYVPVDEDHPCRPISPYGVSKLAGEHYAMVYFGVYGLPTVCIRPFNVYGVFRASAGSMEAEGSGVVSRFFDRVLRGLPPIIHGDGLQTRDFIHVWDLVELVDLALEREEAVGGVFNCGTGRETSINELAHLIIRLAGLNLEPIHSEARPGDIRRSCADIRRTKDVLGFRPKIGLEEGLKAMLEGTERSRLGGDV